MTARARWAAMALLSISLFVIMMDMTVLIMALPELVKELQPSATQQLWIVDSYALLLVGLLIPASALADRWGRRRFLLLGFAIFGAVSLAVLWADSPANVIVLRALLGAAGAMIMPTTLSMIRTLFPDAKERATALAVWSIVSGAGAVLGPLVGGLLLEWFDWRAAFLINLPFVALSLAGGLLFLPEARNPTPPRWDLLSSGLALAGMSSLVWAIKRLADQGVLVPTTWVVLVTAMGLVTWFVVRTWRSPAPLIDLRLFESRPFLAGATAALASMFAMAALLLLVAQWLQVVEGLAPIMAGVALLPMAVGAMVFAWSAPNLALRYGAREVLSGGLALAGIGLIVVVGLSEPIRYIQVLAPLVLVGAGIGSLAIASAIIMGATPADKAGSAAAIEESMYDLGNVLGIATLGSVGAVLYRRYLAGETLVEEGLAPEVVALAEESVTEAMRLAHELGIDQLAAQAEAAFNTALRHSSGLGGLIMVAAAMTTFLMIPREYDLAAPGSEGHEPASRAN